MAEQFNGIYRFPAELGKQTQFNNDEQDANALPYVRFEPVKYNHKNKIIDTERGGKLSLSNVGSFFDDTPGVQVGGTNVGLQNGQVRTPSGVSIYLPLPNNPISNNYAMNWEMADTFVMSSVIDGARSVAGAQGIFDKFMAAGKAGADVISDTLVKTLLNRGSQIMAGQTFNPKKQALFNGIEPRTFSFDYILTPQSLHEAELVERIVRIFATYSQPRIGQDDSWFLFPYEFDITFHNISGLPKLSTCVCTGVSISPATLQLLESGHPVQTALSLSFLETDLRTQNRPGI